MAKGKTIGFKAKLGKFIKQARLPPLWAAVKKYGRVVHPVRLTRRIRHWRRNKIRKIM